MATETPIPTEPNNSSKRDDLTPGRWYEARNLPNGRRKLAELPDDHNEPMPKGAYRIQRNIFPGLRSR